MKRANVVIVGGGFAGASTAWWLKRLGVDRVVVLEQEDVPGAHASGKNAGIARMAVEETSAVVLAARSVSFIRQPPPGFTEVPLFTPTAGFLVSSLRDDPRLEDLRKNAFAAGVFTYKAERLEVLERLPEMQDAPFASILACPSDGTVDIHALLSAYLHGVQVRTGTRVKEFERSGKKITAALTDDGPVAGDVFVLAAGAWSTRMGQLAGAGAMPIEPRRRHLLHTGALDWVRPSMPYLWSRDPAVYFRPESGGLLLSPCDETVSEPCSPPTDPEAPAWLAEKLAVAAPRLANLPIARSWSELRCFAPDGQFVIGRDTALSNLFWVCGLGGHGMTTSAAVGELAAHLITRQAPPLDPAPYDPKRFGALGSAKS